MKRASLYFIGPQKMEFREEEIPDPGKGEIQLRSLCSAISAGTEMLIYSGKIPIELEADSALPALLGRLAFPLKYGYSMVGEVTRLGEAVEPDWKGRRVFAFNPHETVFNAEVKDVQILPYDCSDEDAAFLANMETAVNLVLDGRPLLGEKVVVLGQGVVGLLTTALLARHPLDQLFAADGIELRRDFSRRFGAQDSFAPEDSDHVKNLLGPRGADLVYELTGNPEALNLALALVGEHGRIVVGSWYGTRQAPIYLGGHFHRGRVKIISSQVSQIEPALRGRWDKARRFEAAWNVLRGIKPSQLITHRFSFDKAVDAYKLLAANPEKALGVLLHYEK
ncbi:MAG: zinc-binding dehydrogenase [Chloroflexi bacterium]|nr:zinc-binding dehydrogenase [Chloroflexota bacterium]